MKNFARYRSENNFVGMSLLLLFLRFHQNNFVGILKIMSNA